MRKREGDAIVLTTYGRSSGFCIDPIEKKPLNHFLPGYRGALVRHAGCNLAPLLSELGHLEVGDVDTLADEASPEMLADAAVRLGCGPSRSPTTTR